MNEEEKEEYEDLQYQKYAIEQTLIDITDPSYRDVIYNEIKKSSYINPDFINNVWF